MSCGSVLPPRSVHIVALDGFDNNVWVTDWIPTIGMSNVMMTWKQRSVTGNFRGLPIQQVAEVRPDLPGAITTFDSALNGAGEKCTGLEDMGSATAAPAWIRFGIQADISSGTTTAQADVEVQVVADVCGITLPSVTLSLETTTTANQYATISGWVPSLMAAKIKAAVICRSLTGNFQWRLAFRTATTSKEDPSAWSTAFDSVGGDRTAGEFNTGELAPTNNTTMWTQFAIQYSLSSAGTGQATITVAPAIRK